MTYGDEHRLTELVRQTTLLLQSIGGIEAFQEEISYYTPSKLRPKFPTLSHIHVRLCDSIRNTAWMRRVITDRYFQLIANQLLGQGLKSICSRGIALVTQIVAESCHLSQDDQNERRAWATFKQGVVDGACYLKRFGEPKEFYEYIDCNVATVDEAWALVFELDRKIKGIGPALACDFLKEIGVDRFGKPDIWIKRTFSKLNFISEVSRDRVTFGVIWHMSDVSGISPAVIDKIFWMAASGRWDKTLDKRLDEASRKKEQIQRRQRFTNLLDHLL